MTSRTIPLSLAAVIAICAVGAGGYAFGLSEHRATVVTASHPGPAPSSKGHRSAAPALALIGSLPTVSNRALTWSPMDELAPSKRVHHGANVTITRATVPPPLNLELPANIPSDTDSLDRDAGFQESTSRVDRPAIIDPLVLNMNPNVDDHDAEFADDAQLFNRNNGLRGFMAQNWLNKNVGLQGGLAIKENRLREENSDLRDNVAVGMGILLAF